ncbi:MAG: LysM peptidoglycan-binding domain-containing protein [Chlorobia bacterium]|nr:LysM peptidoglycan-binding domain-containing protein [Fimbriimonadaceae bacterium]
MIRASSCIALIGFAALAISQQPLPNLKVDLDGKPAELAPVMLELNTYLVPLRQAVTAITSGRGKLRPLPGTSIDIMVDDQVRIRIPMNVKAGQYVEVFGKEGPPKAVKQFPIESYPYEITPKGSPPATFIDVELLCSAFGITTDFNGAKLSMITPQFWAKEMGVADTKIGDRLLLNLENLPEFGVSPPARTILGWVRPARASFVQAYRLDDGRKDPIVGVNALGDPIEVITPGDTPKVREARPDRPLRFETYNYGDSLGKTISFVTIVASKDIGERDPIQAINSGDLKPNEWSIVGIRQRVSDLPVIYDNVAINQGEEVAAFAERNKNAPAIVRALNGLRQGASVPPGTKLCVMIGLSEELISKAQSSRYEFKGLYEVQPGDTLKSLADAWSVTPDDIQATNAVVPAGGEPLPGDLLNVIAKKDGVATTAPEIKPAEQENVQMTGIASAKVELTVTQTSRPDSPVVGKIPKDRYMELIGKVEATNMYRVRYEQIMGFVPGSSLDIRESNAVPLADPNDDIVAREALKYLGTPYLWGGNSLTRGIDCSHYVAAVYNRIGWKAPSPPVVIQETVGEVIHCKPGQARRAGRTIVLPDPVRFRNATSNMRSLGSGDRVIFQRGLTDASGTRHTGLYIGRVPATWRKRFGEIPYAFAHASSSRGVTVGSLTSRYYWNLYRFSCRSARGG